LTSVGPPDATHPRPGLHTKVPYDVYAAWPAINHSSLRHFSKTPLHARQALLEPPKQTRAFEFGWCAHIAILEPERLEEEILPIPKLDRRTTAGKLQWDAFQRRAAGRKTVQEDEMDKLRGMRRAIDEHPTAREILRGQGSNEVSVVWTDKQTGVLCKGRLDRLGGMRNRGDLLPREGLDLGAEVTVVADLKTIGEPAELRVFERQADNYGYFEQAGMYLDGLDALSPRSDRHFVWIVVETEPPHGVRCFEPDEEALAWGRKQYRQHLEMYAECKRTNVWRGWDDGVETCSLPPWRSKVFELSQ